MTIVGASEPFIIMSKDSVSISRYRHHAFGLVHLENCHQPAAPSRRSKYDVKEENILLEPRPTRVMMPRHRDEATAVTLGVTRFQCLSKGKKWQYGKVGSMNPHERFRKGMHLPGPLGPRPHDVTATRPEEVMPGSLNPF